MVEIRKNSVEYRMWLERRNKKNLKRRVMKKIKKKRKRGYNLIHKHIETAPCNLSLIDNIDESLMFFNAIIAHMKSVTYSKSNIIMVNLSNVTNLTIDAIMYLLAIIYNMRCKRAKLYKVMGNFPENDDVNKKLSECGFFNYVVSKKKNIPKFNNEKFAIKSGSRAEPVVAKEICDYVIENTIYQRKDTRFLFEMLIELMTNTIQHAYNNNSSFLHRWYVFVENSNDILKFIFLDTGEGIPETIRKKTMERFKEEFYEYTNINLGLSDNKYILSSLLGQDRSETQLSYRGKGLPRIYKYFNDGTIQNLKIISNQGLCFFNDKFMSDTKNRLYGTLFYWEVNCLRKEIIS